MNNFTQAHNNYLDPDLQVPDWGDELRLQEVAHLPCKPNYPAMPSGSFYGLTKREYFAAMCLQGLLANSHPDLSGCTTFDYANMAIDYADVLIKKLNGKQ